MTTTSKLQPWAVTAMPTVWLAECDPIGLAHAMRPLGSTEHAAAAGTELLRFGQMLWGTRTPQGEVAIAWDWVELPQRVLVLADPMQILSNLQIKHADGHWMNERHRILWLNDLLATLPWQEELVGPRRHQPHPTLRLAA